MLRYVGFNEDVVTLLMDYVADRCEAVRVSDRVSFFRKIYAEVPQGSILGSLLFIIYTSSLPNILKYCKAQFYADDTKIYYSFSLFEKDTAFERINEDLESLFNASKENSLFLNARKSAERLFGKKASIDKLGNFEIKISDARFDFFKKFVHPSESFFPLQNLCFKMSAMSLLYFKENVSESSLS